MVDSKDRKSASQKDRDLSGIGSEPILFQDMLYHAPIGVIQSTLEGKLLFINPTLAHMLGYDSPSQCLKAISNLSGDFHADPKRRNTLVELVKKQGALHNFETMLRRRDGSLIAANCNVRLVLGKAGEPYRLEGFFENITEQKGVERALRASEELYRSVFENTGTGTVIIEEDTTISKANAVFCNLFGYAKEAIEGKLKWTDLVARSEDLERMRRYHARRRENDAAVPNEYESIFVDGAGREKNVFLRVDLIAGTDKSIASITDLSSLKKMQSSYRESQSRLVGVMEAFEGYIYTVSSDYRLGYVNKILEKVVGGKRSDAPCYNAIYKINRPCSKCPIADVFSGKTVKAEFLNPVDNRWYYAVSSPVYLTGEKVENAQFVLLDIHKRKIAELAVKEREEQLHEENERLRATLLDRYRLGNIIGKSPPMQQVYKLILRAAATDANVIIYGESGTGKELVAREIHNFSQRKEAPFVVINCGAIPENLMESEFFGYRRGAFTGAADDKPGLFEQAHGGTLFLDEVGEISGDMQVKLLRVLEGHGFIPVGGVKSIKPDVRIVAATNKNLQNLVDKSDLREDFFYRIHILPINLPPLRKRRDDIGLLIDHFLKKYAEKEIPSLRGWELEALLGHGWPGNIRELENTIQRYLSLNRLDLLRQEREAEIVSESLLAVDTSLADLPLKQAMEQLEKEFLTRILEKYRWNRTRVAENLKIERKTLYLKMKRLGIDS